MEKIFLTEGYSLGTLNGVWGWVKLSNSGSIVIRPRPHFWEAISPGAVVRKRVGVMNRLGVFKGENSRALRRWLRSLEPQDRVRESWEWQGPNDRTSSVHMRGGAKLHHRGLPHARNKSGRVNWNNR